MSQQAVSKVCGSFSLEGVDFASKHMSNIMSSQEAWAKEVLAADRAQVKNAAVLNANNRNQNTYGLVRLGVAVQARGWESRDASVQKALNTWIQNLNQLFPARASYKPGDLPQYAADLEATAECIEKNKAQLLQRAEITPNDNAYLQQITDGLRDGAAKIRGLHAAVCKGPDIGEVFLDIAPQSH